MKKTQRFASGFGNTCKQCKKDERGRAKARPLVLPMRTKPETGTSLLEDGLVVCDSCKRIEDSVRKRLRTDDTYAGDMCDRCGHNLWVDELKQGVTFMPLADFIERLRE